MQVDWSKYPQGQFFDELIAPDGPRPEAQALLTYLAGLDEEELVDRQHAAELAIKVMGITFTVYKEGGTIDRSWPLDIIPRVLSGREWQRTAEGLKQRVTALNMFIDDVYNDQRALRDRIVPEDMIRSSPQYRAPCQGIHPPLGIWAHVCGSDLVRDKDGTLYVLEDNLRVPSGVSYMLTNRMVMKRIFPELFEYQTILPVDGYPAQLFDTLASVAPRSAESPMVAVLSPGIYNSAYFEHAYLAQEMGAVLVLGSDLVVSDDDVVAMRTIEGLKRVDVIYRRIDDLFMDPEVFRSDSLLGVPGLMRAWRAGNVTLANAPGTGVADDKAIYAYVPRLIRYYLDQDPILPNVPTYLCSDDKEREYVLANLNQLVIKPANESGGYGIVVGSQASKKELEALAVLIKKEPRNFVAQPILQLSTAPTLADHHPEPRHLDLRPFILSGAQTYVTTGGLTRVALRQNSFVVNSSQGGGSKDTWVVEGP
jgi:uncharacterized circularly permuted ATP-grasp superfamily protein